MCGGIVNAATASEMKDTLNTAGKTKQGFVEWIMFDEEDYQL